MGIVKCVALIAAMLLPSMALGESVGTLWGFTKCASPMAMTELQLALARGNGWQDKLASMYKCDDDALAESLSAAGNFADLKAALKDLYIKDRAYISSAMENRIAQNRAENDRSQAIDRAQMEAKISGAK